MTTVPSVVFSHADPAPDMPLPQLRQLLLVFSGRPR